MTVPDPGLHNQDDWRGFFRIGGWIALALGVLLTAIAVIGFFSAFGSMGEPVPFGPPPNFWLAFVGLPLIAVGSWLLKAGYVGAATRYVSGEVTPPLRDALGNLGIGAGQLICQACGGRNASDARFCDDCGAPMRLTCPACKADNAGDAKFCDDCGKPLVAA